MLVAAKALTRIGAGTGIFTRALLADPKWNAIIEDLRAMEPSQGMRDVFARTVKDDRIVVSEGTFGATGVMDNWADLVVVAQVRRRLILYLIMVTYPEFRLSIGVQTTTLQLQSSLAFSNLKALLHSSGTLRTGESCHI